MRKVVASIFLSLDGVMQAPGGPEEDPTGGFAYGGWTVPYWDDALAEAMEAAFSRPFDLLLGRRTYDIFAAHWPHVATEPGAEGYEPGEADIATKFNDAAKHVATHSPDTLAWSNSHWLGEDVAGAVRELKRGDGAELLIQGSSVLLQTLLSHDLVDEFRLLIYPVVLGRGKRLFGEDTRPGALDVVNSTVSPSGVIIANYTRAGDVGTGSFAFETPTAAELERRKTLT